MALFDDDYSFLDIDFDIPDMKEGFGVYEGDDMDFSLDDFINEIVVDTPMKEGFGVYEGDDMDFDIEDYVDLASGLSKDDPFYIDFDSKIPDMKEGYGIYEGDDMGFDARDYDTGIFGGRAGPILRDIFVGRGQGPLGGNVLAGGGILGQILGFGGQGGGQGGGIRSLFGLGGDGGGGFGGSPLLSFLAMKSLLKDEPSAAGSVPIGGQAYGGPAFNYQDYQPTNLQPALMPGVAYANMAAPAMMVGGEAKQYPNKGLAALAKEAPEVVERMGYEHGGSIENRPGDITFAKLEPGEFVIQKPAVDAIGIETLRKINSMGDGRPYYG